jgi:hypothetical protein
MPTVGQITDKISELKSKIAIKESLITYVQSNYMSSDAGSPEMTFQREDYATVPEVHISRFVDEAVDEVGQLRAELEQWQSLDVPLPTDEAVGAEQPEEPPTKTKVKANPKTRKMRKKNGANRGSQNRAASGQDGSEGAG